MSATVSLLSSENSIRRAACYTGGYQHRGIICDPVGTKDMTAKSLLHRWHVHQKHVHRWADRKREIYLKLAIKEGSSMGGLYMSCAYLNARTGGQRDIERDRNGP